MVGDVFGPVLFVVGVRVVGINSHGEKEGMDDNNTTREVDCCIYTSPPFLQYHNTQSPTIKQQQHLPNYTPHTTTI
jgi:hypothetical protein